MEVLQNFEFLLSATVFILYLLIQILKLIISICKSKKNKKKELVEEKVLLFIQEAETLFSNGIIKKEFVLDSINKYLKEKNIKYEEEQLEQLIEKIISLSKTINYVGEENE